MWTDAIVSTYIFFLNHSLKQLVKGQRNISLTTMYYLVYGKIEN